MVASMVAVRPLLRLARSNPRKDERTFPGRRLDASGNAADWMITDPEELLLNSNYYRLLVVWIGVKQVQRRCPWSVR
jgi:hypothetical protein